MLILISSIFAFSVLITLPRSGKIAWNARLRGKVINTEKAKMEDIFKNEEINTMIYTIGAGVGANFELSDVNYDKIIIMTDADTDGAHIQVLLLTFFFRYMRELVEVVRQCTLFPPLLIHAYNGKRRLVIKLEYVLHQYQHRS